MTITSTPSEISYAGDSVTVAFPIPFVFDTAADLKVLSTDADGNVTTLTTGFSVGGGGGSTGTLTFTTAPASTVDVTILDNPEIRQSTDYVSNDPFPAESHERALDRLTRICKRLAKQFARSLHTQDGDPITDLTLGSVDNRKGKYLFFNAITGAIEYAVSIVTTTLSQSIIAQLLNPQTAAEAAAGVVPTNYWVPSHDSCGRVYPERYGSSGNATALANGRLVAKQANAVLWIRAATYSTSTVFLIDQDSFKLHMERGTLIAYSGTDAAIRFSGCSNAHVTGAGNVQSTNTAAITVDFAATAGAHCLFNTAEFHTIQGAGRGAAPGTLTNIGVKFGPIATTRIVYWNKLTARRIIDVNTGVKFDAPNGSAGDGGNANTVYDAMLDNYWYGIKYRAIECFAINIQSYGSPGSGADIAYLHYIENASFYNKITASGGEPGPLSSPYFIAAGCNYNAIDGQFSNFGQAGTDLGDGTEIRIGRELYRGTAATGDVLTENANYRLMKLSIQNTNGGVATLRWRSRNAVQGYYSSGAATIMVHAQGAVTAERIEATFQESDQTVASQTRFIGVMVSGFDVYPVFSVRNFGGANATTNIDLSVDCVGLEVHQFGPTVEAGALSARAATTIQINKSVADDGTILLPNGVEGSGTVSAGAEMMDFTVLATGVVAKASGTANTVATDTDANLCVFDSGTYATIRNRLGSTQIVKGSFSF